MVKVRILTSVAGPGIAWSPGDIVDMPEAQADAWADGVRAERVARPRAETAITSPPEAAVDQRPAETTMARAPENRAAAKRRRRG